MEEVSVILIRVMTTQQDKLVMAKKAHIQKFMCKAEISMAMYLAVVLA